MVARPAPFVDWPNHLARVFIGTRLWRDEPHWAAFYMLNPHPVPNEALDLGIGALTLAGLDVDVAAALFLVFAYGVFVLGFCRLARAWGGLDASKPVLGALLFLTGPLMYGLVNYMLGLGFAFWLAAASETRGRARWIFTVAAGTVALFYVHLLACVALVLLLFCTDLARVTRGGPARRQIGASVAAALVLMAMLALTGAANDSVPRADGTNIYYPGHTSLPATLAWKGGIFLRMLSDHASVGGAILAAAGVLAFVGLSGRVRLTRAAWFATGLGLAMVLALPEAAGTGSLLDYRLALLPLAAAAAAARWHAGGPSRAAFVVLCALLAVRSVDFMREFAREGAMVARFDAAARALPPATMLLIARGRADEDIGAFAWWSPPTEHLGTRAALAGVFVPTVFAVATQQPVVLREKFALWRHEWRAATEAERIAMMGDIAPICAMVAEGTAPGGLRHVVLLEVYPGQPMRDAFGSEHVLAEEPQFRLVDPCGAHFRAS